MIDLTARELAALQQLLAVVLNDTDDAIIDQADRKPLIRVFDKVITEVRRVQR